MSGAGGPAGLAIAAGSILAWSLLSVRLERWRISAAMLFVALGLVLTNGPLQIVDVQLHSHTIEAAAELALAMVLFTDASRVNFNRLRADAGVPSRLLFIGLPLAIAIGAVVALVVFRGVDGWIALLVAVIVAPTDAALGAPVIEDEHVPSRIRRALNVESGLNDGLATPVFTIVLALAVSHGDGHGAGPVTELARRRGGDRARDRRRRPRRDPPGVHRAPRLVEPCPAADRGDRAGTAGVRAGAGLGSERLRGGVRRRDLVWRGMASEASGRRRSGHRPGLRRRRDPLCGRLVDVRGDARAGARRVRLAGGGLRGPGAHTRARSRGRGLADRCGLRPCHRPVRGLVRAPRARVGGVLPDRLRRADAGGRAASC